MTKIIKATSNESKRTFTLRCYDNNVMYAKYRTNVLSKEEFISCLNNTDQDWKQFLKSNDYNRIR